MPEVATRLTQHGRNQMWPGWAYAASSRLPPARIGRLVVLTEGRSGSEALVTRLDSHPQMRCDSEILSERRRWPERIVEGRVRLARSRGCAAYGFKVLSRHLLTGQPRLREPEGWLRRLADDGWVVVHLSRRNRLHQAVSAIRATLTQFHFEVGEAPPFSPITVAPALLDWVLGLQQAACAEAAALLEGVDPISLVYEDDLEREDDQRRTVELLQDRLGLRPADTTTRQARINPPLLRDMVDNYDEIAAHVAAGAHGVELDPPVSGSQGAAAPRGGSTAAGWSG